MHQKSHGTGRLLFQRSSHFVGGEEPDGETLCRAYCTSSGRFEPFCHIANAFGDEHQVLLDPNPDRDTRPTHPFKEEALVALTQARPKRESRRQRSSLRPRMP